MGALTLLQHCRDVADIEGLPEPSSIIQTDDPELRKLRAAANQIIQHIASRFAYDWNVRATRWKQLVAQTSVVNRTLAEIAKQNASSTNIAQGSEDIVILPRTVWNLSKRQPLNGPFNPEQRSAVTVIGQGGAFYNWWIENGAFCCYPYIPVGDEIQLYYRDARGVLPANTPVSPGDATAPVPQLAYRFSSDQDRPACSDHTFSLGLQYKWRERSGFPFTEIWNSFELALMNESSKVHNHQEHSLDTGPRALQPGIVVNGIPVPPSI